MGSAWIVEAAQLGALVGSDADTRWRMLENLGLNNWIPREDEMWTTENVIGPKMVPQCPNVPSFGSVKGVSCVADTGTVMPNIGEKRVKPYTLESRTCCRRPRFGGGGLGLGR